MLLFLFAFYVDFAVEVAALLLDVRYHAAPEQMNVAREKLTDALFSL